MMSCQLGGVTTDFYRVIRTDPKSYQRNKIADVFWYRMWLKEVSQYLCLFVFIRGSSLLDDQPFFLLVS